MMDDSKEIEVSQSDEAEKDLITYTQIACSALGNYTSAPERISLRARLEREREENEQRQQKSFGNTFRNLFG